MQGMTTGPVGETRTRIGKRAMTVIKVAKRLEYVAAAIAVCAVLAGLATAATSSTDGVNDTTHAYVGLGIAVVAAGLVSAVLYWLVGSAVALFADHVAAQYGIDAESTFNADASWHPSSPAPQWQPPAKGHVSPSGGN